MIKNISIFMSEFNSTDEKSLGPLLEFFKKKVLLK